jgi:hypothetical protein
VQYAFGQGRKRRTKPRFDQRDPHAIAICDGCGFLVQHNHLREQRDYRGGSTPVPLGIWVCASCQDQPQPYFARQLLRPDPVPVRNPRPDYNPSNDILTQGGDNILAQDGGDIVTQAGSDGGIAAVTEDNNGG